LRRLLIRPGGIGDCILALPALECLRADYTEVWAPESVVPLIRFADRVCSITSTGLDLVGLPGVAPPPAVLDRLRSFDSIVSWYGSNRVDFRAEVARFGFPFQFFPALPGPNERTHATDFFLEQIGCTAGATPRIPCPQIPREKFAVIHPFSGSPRKNWPLAKYTELAERLPLPVRWCAGPEESLEGAVRIADLYELACWISGARIYIGNDSGITHLAAASGVPTIAIFGPTDPAVWAPRGGSVAVVAGTLEEITVQQILDAANRLLQ